MRKEKVVYAVVNLLTLEHVDGMLRPYNQDCGVVTRPSNASSIVQNTVEEVVQVNYRTINPSLLIDENEVSVIVKEYARTNTTMTQIGTSSVRRYPLQRELLGYFHNLLQGYSCPIQKLFVHINDIEYADKQGDIVLDEEYVDEACKIEHQKRFVNRYKMDDEHLQARQFSEIFIITEAGEEVIDDAKVRAETEPIPYTRTDKLAEVRKIGEPEARAEDEEFCYQKVEISEEWTRPDGTPFVKKTEDWERIAKPKPPAPVPPQPITVTIPVHHWNKGSLFRGGHWDWNIGYETVSVEHGQPVPTAIILNSDYSFGGYWY